MGKVAAPALSNDTIQKRLLTGASTKGGARGSLTRCVAKLGSLHARLNTPGGSTDQEIQAIKEELKREVRLFQVEMRKWVIMIQSAQQELRDATAQERAMATAVEAKQNEIQDLRDQAVKVARTRICWQEYETLAKLARQRSPRRVLQAKMEKANADLEKTKRQLYETAAESKVREKQFHLLIQCMLDLKRSLGEAVEIPPMKKKEEETEETADDTKGEVVEEAEANQADETADKTDDNGDVQPMDTQEEEEEAAEEEEGDDDDLYGGL
jgi:Tho complex subunit 7